MSTAAFKRRERALAAIDRIVLRALVRGIRSVEINNRFRRAVEKHKETLCKS